MLPLFDDKDFFQSGELKITYFNIPDAELTLYRQQEPITIHGKTHPTPRLTAWYGKRREQEIIHPITPALEEIKQRVETQSGIMFSSVLLNLYRTGMDSVSWHRDNEKEYGLNPVIGSVSFGETRPFRIRHKFRNDLDKIDIPLNHGSFLLMAGPMQHYWEHQVPKTRKEIKPRINLTFRVVQ